MHIPAIIMVNNDLTDQVKSVLMQQLFINEAISGAEFDARFSANPNYPLIIHQNHLRILVIRSFRDMTNRSIMDVVIFIKDGLAYIEHNKIGPTGHALPIATLHAEKFFKHYPPTLDDDFCFDDDKVQNNILYPLHPDKDKPPLFPFGSDKNKEKDTIFHVPLDEFLDTDED